MTDKDKTETLKNFKAGLKAGNGFLYSLALSNPILKEMTLQELAEIAYPAGSHKFYRDYRRHAIKRANKMLENQGTKHHKTSHSKLHKT